ncbi:MAG: sulfatase [Candidatus Hydrogenedentes bacterium]|nr:sulfatase [Candidatus Hydrogenedentota bacterium]
MPDRISRRQFIAAAAALGAAGCHLQRAEGIGAETGNRAPNFVMILSEAHGWSSTSVLSDPARADSKSEVAQTPALTRLAEQGMRFSRAYASSPRCTPSRAAILTGKSPAQLHMTFVTDDGGTRRRPNAAATPIVPPHCLLELPESEMTVAESLRAEGYATAHFGKWHVGHADPSRHGFDESDGPTSNRGPGGNDKPNPLAAHEITDRGIAFARRQVQAGKPFYLQLSHYSARNQEDVSPDVLDAFMKRTGITDPRIASAHAAVEEMDTTIGKLLAALDELKIADNTYVVYTTDHGTQGRNENAPLSEGKGTLWEGGIRVPLIVRGPGIEAGSASTTPVIGHDFYPTFLDLAGSKEPLPKGVEGGSLRGVLNNGGTGAVKRPFDYFVFHFPHYDHDPNGPGTAIIAGNYKLIHFYETDKRLLFNLAEDIGEKRDLAAVEPERTDTLARTMDEYLKAMSAQMPTRNAAASTGTSDVPQYQDRPRPPGKQKDEKKGGKRNAIR